MNERRLMILSGVFLALIIAAAGGRFAWSVYQGRVGQDPQTHFKLAVDAMEAYDPNRLSILLDRYPHLTSTQREEDGATLLHQAMISGGSVTYASILVSEGADINARDASGRTPLHALCSDNTVSLQADVVEFLATNGADMNALDHEGQSPLDLIVIERNDYAEVFPEYVTTISRENRKLLISYGATEPGTTN